VVFLELQSSVGYALMILCRFMGVPHPFMHCTWLEKGKLYNEDIIRMLRLAHDIGR
jgi:hypothetical protein